ncbi:MAG: FHA domain-containing protein [Acidobacteriota bacterium]
MGAPFSVEVRGERASVSSGKSTLFAAIRVAAHATALERERAPLAVCLVLDVSGSMKGDAIAHVLKSCEMVAELLGPRDRLAIVTFADHAGVRCGLTALDDGGRAQVLAALRDIQADGATNMHAGLEAAAGLLVSASPELRRVMVVLSDGQPNRGLSSASELAAYVKTLRPLGVSALGFGLHHDELVLTAIATAGSGRYAYVPDPIGARVELARAALAHGGIVADSLELKLRPAEGVELVRVVPAMQLRHGGSGIAMSVGDVFVDESRVIAVELALDLAAARGELFRLQVTGRSPDGVQHAVDALLRVDVHAGPHAIDRDAQRDILLVRADSARDDARAHADRGALPAAASLLRAVLAEIDASERFVANDGSPLAELREQIVDEIANYERRGSDAERGHQMKASRSYHAQVTPSARMNVPAPGVLVSEDGVRHQLYTSTTLGRGQHNEIPVMEPSVSRRHANIMYVDGKFRLHDLGSTSGCYLNGQAVHLKNRVELKHGDIIQLGFAKFRLELDK